MNITDRFLEYVSFDTESSELTDTTPSTPGQLVLARYIRDELKGMGLENVILDENGYLMAVLPSTIAEEIPTIGFVAHMDTSPDLSGKDVKPCIVDYQEGDIVLNKEKNIILKAEMFPEILRYKGEKLIVTDGTTLLGADDKAGVAAIVSAMEYLQENPQLKHGKICIAFTPDEEIGKGADHFDVEKFGAEWAYTIDGGELGELEYENFNAASATITIKGLNVHPGTAKDKMLNASTLAMEMHGWLPAGACPEHTEGYEGFFHLMSIEGTVEKAVLKYIIRDHSRTHFENRKQRMQDIVKRMNQLHPGIASIELKDQYYNMSEKVADKKAIIELAADAMKAIAVTPKIKPIRGGTDGARLSFMGLPCPNLFAGGLNFHGRYEFLPIHSLKKSQETIVKIATLLAENGEIYKIK